MDRRNQWCLVLVGLLVLSLSTSGCESFRRKFVRQKKTEKKNELIPVLEPIDYPARYETAETQYKHYYGLWMVWQKDLITELDESSNDKKVRYLLTQLKENTQAMANLVSGDKREQLLKINGQLGSIEDTMDKPAPMRNVASIQSELKRMGRTFRETLKVDAVKSNLNTAP